MGTFPKQEALGCIRVEEAGWAVTEQDPIHDLLLSLRLTVGVMSSFLSSCPDFLSMMDCDLEFVNQTNFSNPLAYPAFGQDILLGQKK